MALGVSRHDPPVNCDSIVTNTNRLTRIIHELRFTRYNSCLKRSLRVTCPEHGVLTKCGVLRGRLLRERAQTPPNARSRQRTDISSQERKATKDLNKNSLSVSFCVPLALPVLNRLSMSRNEHWQSQWHTERVSPRSHRTSSQPRSERPRKGLNNPG